MKKPEPVQYTVEEFLNQLKAIIDNLYVPYQQSLKVLWVEKSVKANEGTINHHRYRVWF